MILIDSNIFLYAAGTDHANKAPSVSFLQSVARGDVDAVTDAEVLQEILHRYRAIRRWDDGRQVYDLSRRLVPVVVAITAEILDDARSLMDDHDEIMARDAVHAAVCRAISADAICSYDRDFDQLGWLQRREPHQF